MVSHIRTPILSCFYHLLWFYVLSDSELGCLAMLARPYPVSGPTYLPQIPHLLHCMSRGAHEVLGTILLACLMSVFMIKPFVLSICDSNLLLKPELSICSPSLLHMF